MSILTVSIYSEIGQGRVDLGEEMNSAWRRVAGRRAAADSEEKQRSRRAPDARGDERLLLAAAAPGRRRGLELAWWRGLEARWSSGSSPGGTMDHVWEAWIVVMI